MLTKRLTILLATIVALVPSALGQQKSVPSCPQQTFTAFKPLPKLEYSCPEGADYDDAILKLPRRISAIDNVRKALAAFTNVLWWQSNVANLNACKVHGGAGELTDDEKQKWRDGEYDLELVGDRDLRLAIISDPCYQTDYSGSVVFLLANENGKTFVSKLIDPYYSRVANSVGFDFAKLNSRTIVEVQTANSLPPSLTSYFFEIDPATNKAVPKNLFKRGAKFTNEIYSDMLMAKPKDVGLPKDATELNIVRNHRLAPSFSAYMQDEHGRIDGRLRRIIYRWNGRAYAAGR